MLKRRKVDTSVEKKIVTGIIISTKFLQTIEPEIDYELFTIPYSSTVINWCLRYFDEYEKAPGIHIQDIYMEEHVKLDEELADLIAKFLDHISKEFEKADDWNEDYLVDQAIDQLNTQKIKNLCEDAQAMVTKGNVRDAKDLVESFNPVSLRNNLGEMIRTSVVTSSQLYKKRIRKPKSIMKPWLTEGSLNMLYAKEGVGKTMLAYIIALAITRKNYRDIEINDWHVKRPAGCLIIDGEMDEGSIRDRLQNLSGPLGDEGKDTPLAVLSASGFAKDFEGEEGPNIESALWREAITEYLIENAEYKVLILDNLFSLTKKTNLLDNEEWGTINQWLLNLRHVGVSVIMLHHAGKSGDQLGASARNFNLDSVIYLKTPKGYKVERDGALFEIRFDKGRDIKPGETQRFSLQIEDYGHNKWLTWEVR